MMNLAKWIGVAWIFHLFRISIGLTTGSMIATIGLLLGTPNMAFLSAAPPNEKTPAGRVDLRPFFEAWKLPPRVQGDRNTCSVFTIAGGLEYAMAKKKGESCRLSIEYLNWSANQMVHDVDDGAYFSDIWKGFTKYGACPEEAMPYQKDFDPKLRPNSVAQEQAKEFLDAGFQLHWIKEWNPNTGLTDDQFQGIRDVLDRGWPVCAGCRWPKKEFLKWRDDLMVMVPPEQVRDGHSVLLVGYRDDPDLPGGGGFIFRNSSNSGRDGLMSFEYARAYVNDGVWIDWKESVAGMDDLHARVSVSIPPIRLFCTIHGYPGRSASRSISGRTYCSISGS
ncbi:MAG: hypothetical protein JW829_05180 [Pirellulales bacterium]|nr:hypothetical protein [Pirellulales bacterium]